MYQKSEYIDCSLLFLEQAEQQDNKDPPNDPYLVVKTAENIPFLSFIVTYESAVYIIVDIVQSNLFIDVHISDNLVALLSLWDILLPEVYYFICRDGIH